MDSNCRSCGISNIDDSLTEDGLCHACDLQEGEMVITQENLREIYARLDAAVERAPAGTFAVDPTRLPS